jgi:glycosyltransferase involved in cell wall biosynthesis
MLLRQKNLRIRFKIGSEWRVFHLNKEYTVVLIHYEQPQRLVESIQIWSQQTVPPSQFIIVDDGSTFLPSLQKIYESLNLKIIKLSHTGNLGYIINQGIKEVQTDYYCIVESSLLPIGIYYAEKMLKRVSKGIQAIPIYCTTESKLAFQNKAHFIAYTHKFSINEQYSEEHKKILFDGWLLEKCLDAGELCQGFWFPVDGFIKHIDDFLNYNETYQSWGCYDLDYMYRCELSKKKTYCYADMAFMHLDYPKTSLLYQVPQEIYYLDYCYRYYRMHNINYLDQKTMNTIREMYGNRIQLS